MNKLSKARAPARASTIRAQEEASDPDVITGTFSFFDINVYAFIDPRSTNSYICTALVNKKKLHVASNILHC